MDSRLPSVKAMHNRRSEDPYRRVPSPSPVRRQIRSRDAYSDDYAGPVDFRASLRRTSSREPSPGGIGRLSTSAPEGWERPTLKEAFSCLAPRRSGGVGGGGSGYYRDRLQPHGDPRVEYVTGGANFNSAASSFSSHVSSSSG